MDDTERLAEAYLEAIGYTDIVYEPDGNITPDFLVNGEIAVEVRRLNQTHDDGSGRKGLEELEISLSASMRNLLAGLGPPPERHSWFVMFSFSRPVAPKHELRRRVREALAPFQSEHPTGTFEIDVGEDFTLTVTPASEVLDQRFILGGWSDHESGGWLLSVMETELTRCVEEKARKIAPHRHRYPEWWLILADHVGFALDVEEITSVTGRLSLSDTFRRIVILSPINARPPIDLLSVR